MARNDDSRAETVIEDHWNVGAHLDDRDGQRYAINDATSFDVSIVELHGRRAASIEMLYLGKRTNLGLVTAMSPDLARTVAATLVQIAEELEAEAATAAAAALAKAAGK